MNHSNQPPTQLDHLLHVILDLPCDDEAIVCGEVRMSYGQLGRRVKLLAVALSRRGLGDGERIAILEKNCHRYVEAQLASACCGAVLVPLNHRLAPRELADILNDSGARAILVGPTFLPLVNALRTDVPSLTNLILLAEEVAPGADLAYEQLLVAAETESSEDFTLHASQELQALSYTSGTTGRPKGVMVSRGNLAFNVEAGRAVLGLTSSDRYLHVLPMFHRAGAWAVWRRWWHVGVSCWLNFARSAGCN
jgi:acyl-CoA synthetase (AMP-forming)/AMP-acid ligase II